MTTSRTSSDSCYLALTRHSSAASKFGLTTRQLLAALECLVQAGLERKVSLLHFHIGSQITEIRKIKSAVQEATRIYAKMREMGVDLRYLDVGGGLGVDYDGSRTSSDASVNYSVQEYANDIVFGIKEVCDQEEVDPPTILSESGRMLVAQHSVLIADVRCVIPAVDYAIDSPLGLWLLLSLVSEFSRPSTSTVSIPFGTCSAN